MSDAITEKNHVFDPEIAIDGVRFRLWKDGDVEIDLNRDYGWDGHYFSHADAVRIRDWLNEVVK